MTEIASLGAPESGVLHDRYAVYRCYSDTGQLLYIGSTGGSGRRFLDHSQKIWFLEVRGITFEWYADELDARNAERRAIHVEHPKYNVVHRNSRRLNPAPREPWKRGQRRARAPHTLTAANFRIGPEVEAQAREILARDPDITGPDLAGLLGKSESYARRILRIIRVGRPA